ncbi:TPA: hypothetical protein ACWX1I_003695 [Elizabethkingia anophelis]
MNLKKLNLVELNAKEMKETEGGFFGPFRAGLTLAYRNWLSQQSNDFHPQGWV